MIKVVVADGCEHVRSLIKQAVYRVSDFEIVGEAENGMQLVKVAKALSHDIVFIDVDMPVIDGLVAAQEIYKQNEGVFIVFMANHNNCTYDALRVHAFDYLIKPFGSEHVRSVLQKIKTVIFFKAEDTLVSPTFNVANPAQKLLIKTNHRSYLLNSEEVILVTRKGRKTIIYTVDGSINTYETLQNLHERLDVTRFFRCHKSFIINVSKVIEIQPWGNKTRIVKLAGIKEDALMTAKKAHEFHESYC